MDRTIDRFRWLGIALIAFAAWIGCGDDTENPGNGGEIPTVSPGAYVINEGNFGGGNGSLSFYNFETQAVTNSVFKTANGRGLGDTVNDIVVNGDTTYIVVNNTQTIEAIRTGTHQSLGAINFPAGSGPYTLAIDSDGRTAYVPLLIGDALAKVDLIALSVEKIIEIGSNPTEVAIVGNRAFVTNSGFGDGTTVSIVNLLTFDIAQLVEVGDNPSAVVAYGEKVVVLCGGRYDDFTTPETDESTPGSIVILNALTGGVSQSIPLDFGASGRMELGANGVAYFLVNGSIAAFDANTNTVLPLRISPQDHGATGFYGLGVDRVSGRVYATDAKDFATAGEALVFESDGAFVTRFGVDLIPRSVAFVR